MTIIYTNIENIVIQALRVPGEKTGNDDDWYYHYCDGGCYDVY